jgi:hypothetical protein
VRKADSFLHYPVSNWHGGKAAFLDRPMVSALNYWLAVSAAEGAKKLIEFGWDEPDTAFMRAHRAEMDQTPFDGCVFHATYRRADGGEGNFTWECWSQRRCVEQELSPALEVVQGRPPAAAACRIRRGPPAGSAVGDQLEIGASAHAGTRRGSGAPSGPSGS